MSSTLTLFARNYLGSFTGLPTMAWKGIFISLIESSLIAICYYLAIYYVKELHFTILQSSTLITCYGVGSMVGAYLAGKLADKFSSKLISSIALFIQSTTYIFLIYNKNFATLIPNLFITGIASYGFITACHAWVLAECTQSESERLKAINLLSVASNLGLGLSAILISLSGFINFTGIFFISAIVLICMGVYIIRQSDNSIRKDSNKQNDLKSTIKYNFQSHALVLYALVCLFLMGILISQFNSNYPIFLVETFTSLGIRSFSILFIINTLMVVFLQTILVDIFIKKNKVILLGLSTLILGLGMLILNFLYNFNIAILSIIFLSIGEILFFSIAQLICYEKSPPNKKGQSLGTFRMVFAFSRIVGPIIGGLIYQKMGGPMLWYFCFLLGLSCFFPAIFLKNKFSS